MEAPKTKTISQIDVIAYFRAAPLEVLDELQVELEKCITKRADSETKVNILQSALTSTITKSNAAFSNAPMPGSFGGSNSSSNNRPNDNNNPISSVPVSKAFSQAHLPGQIPEYHNQVILTKAPTKTTSYVTIDPGVEKQEPANETRSKLMGLMNKTYTNAPLPCDVVSGNSNSGSNYPNSNNDDDNNNNTKSVYDAPMKGGSAEVLDAVLQFAYGDNYGDGLYSIKDAALKTLLQRKKDDCNAISAFFPYGYGSNNDLLKIKGFVRTMKGEIVRTKIKLQPWNKAGKTGYTCYKQEEGK